MATGKIHWNIDGTTLHLSGAKNMPTAWTGYKGTFTQANTAAGYTTLTGSWQDPNAYTPTLTQAELTTLLNTITAVDFASSVTPYSCYKWFEGFNLNSCTITAGATGIVGTTAIKNTSRMFYNAFKGSGKTLTLSFTPNGSTDCSEMFANNPGLKSIDVTAGTYAAAKNIYRMFEGCDNLEHLSMTAATFAVAGTGTTTTEDGYGTPEVFSNEKIKELLLPKATFAGSLWTGEMFCNMTNLTSLDLSAATFAASTNSYYMFANCDNLPSLSLPKATFAKVEDAAQTFRGLQKATTISIPVATFAAATDTSGMFNGCHSITSLALTSFNTAKMEFADGMFTLCTKLETLTLGSNWVISALKDAQYMFAYCYNLKSITTTAARWKNTNVLERAEYMFEHCGKLSDLSFMKNIKTANLVSAEGIFAGVGGSSSASEVSIDITGWDLTKLGSQDSSLGVNGSWFFKESWNVPNNVPITMNVTDVILGPSAGSIFRNADGNINSFPNGATYKGIGQFIGLDTMDVSSLYSLDYLFSNCTNMPITIDISSWDTQTKPSAKYAFEFNNGVTRFNISGLKFTNQNFSYDYMFANTASYIDATNLEFYSPPAGQAWPSSTGTNVHGMFYNATVNKINLEGSDIIRVWASDTPIAGFSMSMFKNSRGFYSSFMEHFYMGNAKSLDGFLEGATGINGGEITLFFCNLSKITSIANFAKGCTAEFIDITALSNSPVSNINQAFNGCTSLKTIYTGGKIIDWSSKTGLNVFTGSTQLKGGNGTTYNASNDIAYARADLVKGNAGVTADQPGYFSPALILNYCLA